MPALAWFSQPPPPRLSFASSSTWQSSTSTASSISTSTSSSTASVTSMPLSSSSLSTAAPALSSSSSSYISCSTPGYDLTPIQQQDLEWVDQDAWITYTIRPCGPVLSAECQSNDSSTQTELCQQYVNGTTVSAFPRQLSQYYPLAASPLVYLLKGEDRCGALWSYLEVLFDCNTTVSGAVLDHVEYEADLCWWTVHISTPYACPGLVPLPSSSSSAAALSSTAQYISSTSSPSIASSTSESSSTPVPALSSSSSSSAYISCYTPGYDLTPIREQDLEWTDQDAWITYTIRPCGAVLSSSCQFDDNTTQTELCQQYVNGTTVSAFPHDPSPVLRLGLRPSGSGVRGECGGSVWQSFQLYGGAVHL